MLLTPHNWMDVPSAEAPASAGMTSWGGGSINIERVSANRHIVWGCVVGVCAAIAFNALLWIQFDAEVSITFLAVSAPICAVVGAGLGWAWWRILGR